MSEDTPKLQRQKKKVALIYTKFAPFISRDYELLSKHLEVEKISFAGKADIPKIMNAVSRSDVSLSWFAGGHASLAVAFSKLFNKRSIIIVGGYDVARVPEINYGQFTSSRLKRMRAKITLESANKVLVVDPSLKEDAIKNAKISGKNISYLPTGYDSMKFRPNGPKENLVVIVGNNISKTIIKRKGLDVFVKTASLLPNVRFSVIGRFKDDSIDSLKNIAPENVEFTGYISDDDLLSYYQRATVYCQISAYEGLPNALCEAMLCECVPVGTDRNGIPTAMGDTGFLVPYGDVKATAMAIANALKAPGIRGQNARNRIRELFPKERRERGLLQAIEEVAGEKS